MAYLTRLIRACAFVLLATAGAGHAETECAGPTSEMVACLVAALSRDDAALNAAYGAAMDGARRGGYDAPLRDAQRLWIPYRDAACTAEAAPYAEGSIHPIMALACLRRLTQDRTRDLRAFEMN